MIQGGRFPEYGRAVMRREARADKGSVMETRPSVHHSLGIVWERFPLNHVLEWYILYDGRDRHGRPSSQMAYTVLGFP